MAEIDIVVKFISVAEIDIVILYSNLMNLDCTCSRIKHLGVISLSYSP